MDWKKLYRIYKEESFTICKRGGASLPSAPEPLMVPPAGANQRRSLDFVSDSLSCGRRFRLRNVIIRHCRPNQWRKMAHLRREGLAAVVQTSRRECA